MKRISVQTAHLTKFGDYFRVGLTFRIFVALLVHRIGLFQVKASPHTGREHGNGWPAQFDPIAALPRIDSLTFARVRPKGSVSTVQKPGWAWSRRAHPSVDIDSLQRRLIVVLPV
jgi:hypothetical protein